MAAASLQLDHRAARAWEGDGSTRRGWRRPVAVFFWLTLFMICSKTTSSNKLECERFRYVARVRAADSRLRDGSANRPTDPTFAPIGRRSVSVGRPAYSWLLERCWRNLA